MARVKKVLAALWGVIWHGVVFSSVWMLTAKFFKFMGWL